MLWSRGYDGGNWYSIHVLLTRQLSRVSNVSSNLRHACMFTSVLICGRTQADKVEARSDTAPLVLAIDTWRSGQALPFLPQDASYSFARFVPDHRGKHGYD